ncbi:MAG TPA: tRNA (N6-isopentenyl adenosine(37)-C2)-methylthiotransferase MiaB [Syntrophales bacterium]|jgi:tRNA-2-methylthio-N6-dimethylallyladenosine synthase|nr:tRNA (N6-isopentenyl adenosine(37)-C2)-methylthiotransferase MiaB [Syntrophales bacterium]HOU76610.1 tRNA (N6-isopentenyl adenosine(37)-C2)-methylthiotransferase MiaB [Syntrophales bacterium]HPC31367.1 tRNA (N6-isopentenyl adenosine(37)-C2)-methylthiotransferase MiaB [Syntrophales bacterium]HQG33273.1 tRNA (N6-isopentenyl adenosine(37)-C2)-methylthiotransferase MiaB [Syntrophales bacterium]HQI35049.1 tRNA (N6-isopentenyl adenosine(37)-C2)-methylthiotransferase MiaB [Syntrophales bacterium]
MEKLAGEKFFIRTFGCQMNVHDSEQLATIMTEAGYERTGDEGAAAVILVNTCSIRDKVAQKIVSQLGRYRTRKIKNPGLIIGVGGCLAQHWGREIFKRAPHVDLVFGTHVLHEVPELVGRVKNGYRMVMDTAFREDIPSLDICAAVTNGNGRLNLQAFVTIMQGCDNFCAYCVVPYLRGRERSRPAAAIIREIEALVGRGVREVTLLGQNVNSYGRGLAEETSFPALLEKINAIPGLERIRFTTSHPKDLSDGLISCFGRLEKLCEHIHLPFQAGANRVLERMNRGYTREEYLSRIEMLRKRCPDIAVTADVMVGFPGETETDFEATLTLMEAVRFDGLFSFMYSEREGTQALSFADKVPEQEKRRRLMILQALQDRHTLEKNRALIGKPVSVLVEGASKNDRREMTGRTRTNKIVNFAGSGDLRGQTVSLCITAAYLHSLRGEPRKEGKADVYRNEDRRADH